MVLMQTHTHYNKMHNYSRTLEFQGDHAPNRVLANLNQGLSIRYRKLIRQRCRDIH